MRLLSVNVEFNHAHSSQIFVFISFPGKILHSATIINLMF